jgi:RNA polymerase sigma-70 factor, ECF subfamily
VGLPEPITRPTETEAARTRDLFDEYGRMVLVLCRALLRDRSDAEDAAQQTFLAAYRGLLAGQQPRQPAAWLATIARNECRARRRNGDDRPVPFELELEAANADPAEIAAARAELAALRDALAELPERQLEVVRLHCFDGLSYDEVAKTLDISSRAVDGLLVRARNRLRRRVADLTRAGALVAPDSVRDRLAQLIPGFEPGGSAVAVAAGGGAGGLAALGSGSAPLTAKLAVATTVGVAALGSGGAGPPFANQHAARAPTQPPARTEPVRRDTPQAQLRAAVVTKGQENRGRSGGEGERRRGSSGPGHNGRGSGQGHDDEPSEPLTPSDNSGPGSAGSGSAGSGSSTSGSSGSSSASSGSSGHGSSGSGKSGSGFDSSGSGSGGPEEPD